MLCDDCKKNEATVHYTEIVNNNFSEFHLCAECAKKKNLYDNQPFGIGFNSTLNPDKDGKSPEHLSEPPDSQPGAQHHQEGKQQNPAFQKILKTEFLKCENCGLTFNEFRKRGKLGCSDCYKYFAEELELLLKQIHHSNRHTGKKPGFKEAEIENYEELKRLRIELEAAVSSEQYEKAITIRDRIKKMTQSS